MSTVYGCSTQLWKVIQGKVLFSYAIKEYRESYLVENSGFLAGLDDSAEGRMNYVNLHSYSFPNNQTRLQSDSSLDAQIYIDL